MLLPWTPHNLNAFGQPGRGPTHTNDGRGPAEQIEIGRVRVIKESRVLWLWGGIGTGRRHQDFKVAHELETGFAQVFPIVQDVRVFASGTAPASKLLKEMRSLRVKICRAELPQKLLIILAAIP